MNRYSRSTFLLGCPAMRDTHPTGSLHPSTGHYETPDYSTSSCLQLYPPSQVATFSAPRSQTSPVMLLLEYENQVSRAHKNTRKIIFEFLYSRREE
jgi:hypothetical protein